MKDFFKKRIPTIIGIILLVTGAVTGVILVSKDTGFLPRATPEFAPQELTVTNITDNSFSISWTTQQKTIGFLKYGSQQTGLDKTQSDDRSTITSDIGEYETHHVTVRNLEPETTYFFEVGSGGTSQLYNDSGQPYSVTTAPSLGAAPPADTAYGQVINSAENPAEGVIVYLNLLDASNLSTLTKTAGQWIIPLSTARQQDLTNYVNYDQQNSILNIIIKGPSGQTSHVTTTTNNDQPVPTIILGQDYDYTQTEIETSPNTDAEVFEEEIFLESQFILDSLGEAVETTSELTILNPSDDGERINTSQPEFNGTAPAGTTLTITVNSSFPISDQITVGQDNTWNWFPPQNLEPGSHEITVEFTDENNILQTITRSFTVFAAGESEDPAFSATPSATPVPTPTPTLTPAPTPTPTPTPSPRISQPSTQSGIPEPGVTTPTFIFLLAGISLIIFGSFTGYKNIKIN